MARPIAASRRRMNVLSLSRMNIYVRAGSHGGFPMPTMPRITGRGALRAPNAVRRLFCNSAVLPSRCSGQHKSRKEKEKEERTKLTRLLLLLLLRHGYTLREPTWSNFAGLFLERVWSPHSGAGNFIIASRAILLSFSPRSCLATSFRLCNLLLERALLNLRGMSRNLLQLQSCSLLMLFVNEKFIPKSYSYGTGLNSWIC